MRGGIRLRRRLGRRGITRLASAIGPVVVGVVVAFAWNTAATHQMAGTDAGVTPEVGLTVEQAAAQAWASSTPGAGKPRKPVRPAGSGCGRGKPPHPVTVLWSSGSPGHPGRPYLGQDRAGQHGAGQHGAGQHGAGQARRSLRACPGDANAAR